MSSWKETQRSFSGPGEAGGEGGSASGLAVENGKDSSDHSITTDVSYQCP